MKLSKPRPPHVHVESIPDELKALSRWIGWRYVYRDLKWDKPPVSCGTGRRASTTESMDWVGFEEAHEYYRAGRCDGVGFVFHENDPYTGIDLDGCRDSQTGRIRLWATDIIHTLDSYSEVSPSGTGVHVILKGKLGPNGRNRVGNVEFYDRAKYFTMTGLRVANATDRVEKRQAEVQSVHERLLSDAEIIRRAKRAGNGEKFTRLWSGDTSEYHSQSEADLALCGMLGFWTKGDGHRVELLFNQSALAGRGKWEAREDYRRRTIQASLDGQLTGQVLTSGTKSNQITRSNQEYTGSKHTDLPSDDQQQVGQGVESIDGVDRDRQGKSITLALDLAKKLKKAPIWDASFALARRLRTLSEDHPEQFEVAVTAYCEKTGLELEYFRYGFLDSWEKVRMAEGDDVLAWANAAAEKAPYPLANCPGKDYGRVASIAWHMSKYTAPAPFFLPRKRLAKLLGREHAMDVTRLVDMLERAGIIKCVDHCYRYAANAKAKEYVFTGPSPEEEGE